MGECWGQVTSSLVNESESTGEELQVEVGEAVARSTVPHSGHSLSSVS